MSETLSERIIQYLDTTEWKGATTDTIADKFNLKNRQVGGIMGSLKRRGLIFTYTKGQVWINGGLHSSGSPMVLSNSFYELIK